MKKVFLFLIAGLVVYCILFYDGEESSASSGTKTQYYDYDNQSETSYSESSSTSPVQSASFYSQEDVLNFISGRRFKDNVSTFYFNGNSGTVDGARFDVTAIDVINSKLAKISIYVPEYGMRGTFTLIIGDNGVVLTDPTTEQVYTMI